MPLERNVIIVISRGGDRAQGRRKGQGRGEAEETRRGAEER